MTEVIEKTTILKRAYIVYIHIIVNYCNINKKQKSSFIKTFLYAIPTIGKYVILAKSFTLIKYLVMLLCKRKSIKNAMMRSKDEGAFYNLSVVFYFIPFINCIDSKSWHSLDSQFGRYMLAMRYHRK